jgi:hypothetical protein
MTMPKNMLKPISIFLIAFMLPITFGNPSAFALMAGTEDVLRFDRHQDTRERLRDLVSREQIRKMLVCWGIESDEAEARIDSLSDDELSLIAEKIAELPVGGDAWGFVIVCAIVVVILVMIVEFTSDVKLFPNLTLSD